MVVLGGVTVSYERGTPVGAITSGKGRIRLPPRGKGLGVHARPFEPQSKVNFGRFRRLLAINAHKMAPRTSKRLQERAWDNPRRAFCGTSRVNGRGFTTPCHKWKYQKATFRFVVMNGSAVPVIRNATFFPCPVLHSEFRVLNSKQDPFF